MSRESDERLVDFYARLTGQDAPAALAEAEARAIALGAELAPADLDLEGDVEGLDGAAPTDAVTRVEGDVGSASQALTWSEFEDTYCRSGADYLFCFPSTGNAWCEKRGLTMEGAVHAKGGGEKIAAMIQDIKKNGELDQVRDALRAHFGLTVTSIEGEWIEWVRANYRSKP